MRLDVLLVELGLVTSRTEAKKFILEGAVTVDGRIQNKPSYDVESPDAKISVDKSSKRYVSRGGVKLEFALKEFNIDVSGKLAVDIGASSGGFTDCLLQNGAAHVISVDSGSGQMVDSIRRDSRVTVIENYNARFMRRSDFEYVPTLAVMDVSFISATYIMPAVYDVLAENAEFVCLIKPQFEVGRSGIGKGGIVKDEKVRRNAIDKVTAFALSQGFRQISVIKSPIEGGDGNVEYLAYFRKGIEV